MKSLFKLKPIWLVSALLGVTVLMFAGCEQKAVTDVARGFGKKTVAEYVENSDVMQVLNSFGVDFAQGYGIGRPVGAEELLHLLHSHQEKNTARNLVG